MLTRRGQSILEYTMIIGILTVVLYYMGTGIKRGVQSLVKITADQVGNQQNSDQDFQDPQTGYMISSNSVYNEVNNKEATEVGYIASTGVPVYVTNTGFNESSDSSTNTITNGGFTVSQE